MSSGKKKRFRYVLIVFASLIVVVTFLNYFLAYRLERYLRKELIQRVSEATDGFYTLAYNDLSISLLSGELKIEGIEFSPDSAVFTHWESIDSLPDTYLSAKVGVIDFKGINLIWRRNYSQLFFSTFEIQKPMVEIFSKGGTQYAASNTQNEENDSRSAFSGPRSSENIDLHELIKPYIDVLSVRTLNLENASVTYTVENPITPIVYGMRDASFHAYGFWLDSLSAQSGKLLYSNNFEFATNQPQVLVTNNDFSLLTDSIRLSTADSIIYIGNIQLMPQTELWTERNSRPTNYIDGQIQKVEVKGIAFRRENALNYLKARSFDIQSSDIKVFNLTAERRKQKSEQKLPADTEDNNLVEALSLYEIISPVLKRVAIDEINLEKTKFNYMLAFKDSIESYRMDNFEFHAYDFLIDSLSGTRRGPAYSRNIAFEATDMEGLLTARNHKVNVGKIALDTDKKQFRIDDIRLAPLSTQTRNDYMSGKVDSLIIDGLEYDNGISASSFRIESPDIRYVSTPYENTKTINTDKPANQRVDVDAILSPFLSYLSIKDIRLNRGNFILSDQDFRDHNNYRIRNFNFFATNLLVNENTNKGKILFFTCDDFGFHFSDFDNYLQKKNYRLTIKDAFFSTIDGKLRFEDIKLIPQEDSWKEAPDTYFRIESPLLIADGIQNPLDNFWKDISIASFKIQSPGITVTKPKEGKTIQGTSDDLLITNILWNRESDKLFTIDEVGIISPQFHVTNKMLTQPTAGMKRKSLIEELNPLVELIQIKRLYIDDMAYHSSQADSSKIDFAFKSFELRGSSWCLKTDNTYIHLNTVALKDPFLEIKPADIPKEPGDKPSKAESKTLYDALGIYATKMSIDTFNLVNATINPDFLKKDSSQILPAFGTIDLSAGGLVLNNDKKDFEIEDVNFKTSNISLPIDNGFFTLTVDSLELTKKDLALKRMHLKAAYPMLEFAIEHPKNADWFNVVVGDIYLSDIDIPYYFSNQILKMRKARLDDVILENYRNQKLPLPRKIVPFIYEGLQKAPVKLDIGEVEVNNMEVTYFELAKKGKVPGKIFFTDMNGTFYGFTNVATEPDQFIRLEANAKLMGDGYFDATWLLPVDTLNDRFIIKAHLPDYDLTTLNYLITPLASASVRSGRVNDLKFMFDASTQGAHIEMLFLYENLKADLLKEKDGELVPHKFISGLVNLVVRDNNPRHPKGNPRQVDIEIVRDPYHSIFNYLWQMLRPSITESVGIPKKNQDFFAGVANVFKKVKNFFSPKKKKETKNETETPEES